MSTRAIRRNGRLYYTDSTRDAEITPAHPEIYLYDDFLGTNTTDIVARTSGYKGTAPGTADTVTIVPTANIGGVCQMLSGTADNDHVLLSTELSFYGAYSPCFEARVALVAVTAIGFGIGFTDTTGIANAGPFTLATTTWTTTAVDGAALVFDTDATTDTIRYISVKNNTDTTGGDTSLVPVAGTYATYRVECEMGSTVTAKFYVDGVLVGTIADAFTSTTALTPFISIGTRTGSSAQTGLVDYAKAWQNRS